MKFIYNGHFYRLTRDRSPDAATFERIREKFNKPDGYYIEVYRLPCVDHDEHYKLMPDIYLGLYGDVNVLLDHCIIDGKTLHEIIPSHETRICGIDRLGTTPKSCLGGSNPKPMPFLKKEGYARNCRGMQSGLGFESKKHQSLPCA